jgi:hypothetical protein
VGFICREIAQALPGSKKPVSRCTVWYTGRLPVCDPFHSCPRFFDPNPESFSRSDSSALCAAFLAASGNRAATQDWHERGRKFPGFNLRSSGKKLNYLLAVRPDN